MTTLEADVRTMREAATSMREEHGISHPRHEMWFEFAGLLEVTARDLLTTSMYRVTTEPILRVARAYLAARSRPDIDGEL